MEMSQYMRLSPYFSLFSCFPPPFYRGVVSAMRSTDRNLLPGQKIRTFRIDVTFVQHTQRGA
jgi:hypothetical protein